MAYIMQTIFFSLCLIVLVTCKKIDKEHVDKVIEDEITQKLSEDLLQSIEKKFNIDLEKAVDSVLSKIKVLLQNGTTHIQEKLGELTSVLNAVKKDSTGEESKEICNQSLTEQGQSIWMRFRRSVKEFMSHGKHEGSEIGNQFSFEAVSKCLMALQKDTTALAEKALHQMVVCGYALIGHDPAQAIRNVMELKAMIKLGLKPIYNKREEVYNLLRVCGHDHDSLKKVIKCVISKSPQLKSAMMSVSGKLIDGVILLTKQMAHGAMHEACLIEVINTVEDEAFTLVEKVRSCTFKNDSQVQFDMEKLLKEDNATVLDIINKRTKGSKDSAELPVDKLNNMMHDTTLQEKLDKSTLDLLKSDANENNFIANDGKNSEN